MNWNLFWTAFGAIGTTLAGFATVGAVIVALWQTKYSNHKKIKLSFHDIATQNDIGNTSRYISVSITNIGNRDVIIDSWSILLPKVKRKIVIFTQLTPQMPVKLPRKLELEENLYLYYPYDNFCFQISKNIEFGDLDSNKEVCFEVEDSTGKKYRISTNRKAGKYIVVEGHHNEAQF